MIQVNGVRSVLNAYAKTIGKQNILFTKPPALHTEVSSLKLIPALQKDAVNISNLPFGRELHTGKIPRRLWDDGLLILPGIKQGPFGYTEDASSYIMDISGKVRSKEMAKYSKHIANLIKENPKRVELDEIETLSKTVIDNAFKKVPGNPYDCVEYRGALFSPKNVFYNEVLKKLKKGDIYKEPGYLWTSPNKEYAFNNYAPEMARGALPKIAVKYHIMLPKGTKMMPVDRYYPETLLPFNSNFKVWNVKKGDNGNMELFIEKLL